MMNVSSIMPVVGHHRTRALVLEQLLYWSRTTKFTDYAGRPVIVPLLRKMGAKLGRSKAALSKAITWLAEQGFLSVRRVKWGNAYRLQIRVLVRLRETVRKRQGNNEETANLYSEYPVNSEKDMAVLPAREKAPCSTDPSPVKPPPPPKPPASPIETSAGRVESRLRGKVEGARDRVARSATERAEKGASGKPKPRAAAQVWNAVLREYGDSPFPLDPKNLAHVRKTLELLRPETLEEFKDRIEVAVDTWYSHRPYDMRKVSAHPWALNRCPGILLTERTIEDVRAMYEGKREETPPVPPAPEPAPAPAAEDTPPRNLFERIAWRNQKEREKREKLAAAPKVYESHPDTPKGGGGKLLDLLRKKNSKYKGATSSKEEG